MIIIIIISVQSIIGTSASYSRSSRLRFASTPEENIKFLSQIVVQFLINKIFDLCDKILTNNLSLTLLEKNEHCIHLRCSFVVKSFNLTIQTSVKKPAGNSFSLQEFQKPCQGQPATRVYHIRFKISEVTQVCAKLFSRLKDKFCF